MKILLVHSQYASSASGENEVFALQCRALHAVGHEVFTFTQSSKDLSATQQLRLPLNVATFSGKSPVDLITRIRPDIIHIHNTFPNISTRWVAEATVPVVATLHNFRPICSAATLLREAKPCRECLDRSSFAAIRHACYRNSRVASIPLAIATRQQGTRNPLIKHARRLIVLSQRNLNQWISILPETARPKVVEIPNFVDGGGNGKTGGPSNGTHWLFVGRLSPEKGILELIRAWPNNERLTVLGDGPLLENARNLATGKPITIRGYVSQDEVADTLRSARALILPSLWQEGLPTIMLHAMRASVPLLTLAGSTIADVTYQSGGGLVASTIGDLVQSLPEATDRQEELANNAFNWSQRNYTEQIWVDRMTLVYSEATSEVINTND